MTQTSNDPTYLKEMKILHLKNLKESTYLFLEDFEIFLSFFVFRHIKFFFPALKQKFHLKFISQFFITEKR